MLILNVSEIHPIEKSLNVRIAWDDMTLPFVSFTRNRMLQSDPV